MLERFKQRKWVYVLVAVMALGTLSVTPAGAHFAENTKHLAIHTWQDFIKPRVYTRKQIQERTYTRNQSDNRFVNNDEADSVDGSMVVNDSITGFDINADNPLGFSPLVMDVVYVSESTASNSDDVKALTVECPDAAPLFGGDHSVIGGGATTDGGGLGFPHTEVKLGASRPDAENDGWFAIAQEVNATASNWALTVYAICARI